MPNATARKSSAPEYTSMGHFIDGIELDTVHILHPQIDGLRFLQIRLR